MRLLPGARHEQWRRRIRRAEVDVVVGTRSAVFAPLAAVAALCPTAAVARLDRDTARRRGAGAALLDRFRAGAVQVLVGTQLIAKGHDFPNVTLVGVVSADVALHLADFRAAERTFQLLTQVAGRAGRGDRPGAAIVQSFHPRHYSIVHACRQAYGPFFDQELRYRASLGYPPSSR